MSQLRYESKQRRARERVALMQRHFHRFPNNDVVAFCKRHRACTDGRIFAMYYDTLDALWAAINNPEWLLWMADRLAQSNPGWTAVAAKLREDKAVFDKWQASSGWALVLKSNQMCADYMRQRTGNIVFP